MSGLNVDEYVVNYGAAKAALQSAIEKASAMGGDSSLSLGQQADAVALASDLGPQLLLLVDAHNRFKAQFFLPNPPSQATVDAATAQEKALAQVVADNLLAVGKLEAVIGIISALNELAKPAAAPAAEGAVVASTAPVPSKAQQVELAMAGTTTQWLKRMRATK